MPVNVKEPVAPKDQQSRVDAGTVGPLVKGQPLWWGGSPRPIVTIASVYPAKCQHEMCVGANGGFTKYVLPAAPRDGVSLLRVTDTGQMIMAWEVREMRLAPIAAVDLATSLVERWTANTLGAKYGRPGIWMCAQDEPTQEEIDYNKEIQSGFFHGLIQSGTDLYHKGEQKNITDLHRRAATWLLGTGANSLPWYPKTEFRPLKACPACGEEILSAALKCKFCQTLLPEFYKANGLDPSQDAAVMAVLAAAPAPAQAPAQPKPASQPQK